MLRTRVGYSGGLQADPTYHKLGDHAEAIQLDFDPQLISYGQLLDVFWNGHNPHRRSWSRQYMAAIFFHGDKQQNQAKHSKLTLERANLKPVHTVIVPATQFYQAELYHQKYLLRRNRDLFKEFEAMYPDPQKIVDSTAAARINGYLGGYGNLRQLTEDLPLLGLSDQSQQKLWQIAERKQKRRSS